jgi:hypothetical protein
MPLFGAKLFRSRWYVLALGNPRAGLAAMKLWWEAWQQIPAGSLPNDDIELSLLADFGADLRAWSKARNVALHGFVECSDGRIYHPFVSAEAVKAYEARLRSDAKRGADRERLRRWREMQSKNRSETHHETATETRFIDRDETPDETVSSQVDRDRDRDSRQIESSSLRSDDAPAARARRAKPPPPPLPTWLPTDAWDGFVDMRRAKGKKLTPYGEKLALKTLEKLRSEGHDPRAVLEQTIMRTWDGLFPVKDDTTAKFNGRSFGQAPAALNRTERNRLEIDQMFGGDDGMPPIIENEPAELGGETQ